jgi:hypothetical protein
LTPDLPIPHILQVGWPGTEKNSFLKNALLNKSRVLNSKCPDHSPWEGVKKKNSASYVKNGKHTGTTFLFENNELNEQKRSQLLC